MTNTTTDLSATYGPMTGHVEGFISAVDAMIAQTARNGCVGRDMGEFNLLSSNVSGLGSTNPEEGPECAAAIRAAELAGRSDAVKGARNRVYNAVRDGINRDHYPESAIVAEVGLVAAGAATAIATADLATREPGPYMIADRDLLLAPFLPVIPDLIERLDADLTT